MMYGYPEVLIIGNGFDLNLGLKTAYIDFLKSPEFIPLLRNRNTIANTLFNKFHGGDWIDIENELRHFSEIYTVSSQIERDFDQLREALSNYLRTIDVSTMNTDSLAYKFFYSVAQTDCKILDFNYTSSTDFILGKKLGMGDEVITKKLMKVHGSIENDDIIFGVEDGALIEPDHIFLKKSCNTNFKGFNIGELLHDTSTVHIFGHSLGDTDATYFKPFFERVVQSWEAPAGKNTIHLYYHGKSSWNNLMKQIDLMTSSQLNIFKGKVNLIPANTFAKEVEI